MSKLYRVSRCCAIIAAVWVVNTATPVQAAIINGGFETGNFAGWSINYPAKATVISLGSKIPVGIWLPGAGESFAYLSSGARRGAAGVNTLLSQTFSGRKGEELSFKTFYSGSPNAEGFAKLLNLNDLSFMDLFSTSTTSSGWKKMTYVLPESGSYTVFFGAKDLLAGAKGFLGVDAVRLTTDGPSGGGGQVPEPASLLIWVIAAIGGSFAVRRRLSLSLSLSASTA